MKKPTLLQFIKTILYIGVTGYGGPAILGHMKKILVNDKEWVKEEDLS
jgi:chromate transport protein ChrA